VVLLCRLGQLREYWAYKAEIATERAQYQYEMESDQREYNAEIAAEVRAQMDFEYRNEY
jgi:hypothetical protein